MQLSICQAVKGENRGTCTTSLRGTPVEKNPWKKVVTFVAEQMELQQMNLRVKMEVFHLISIEYNSILEYIMKRLKSYDAYLQYAISTKSSSKDKFERWLQIHRDIVISYLIQSQNDSSKSFWIKKTPAECTPNCLNFQIWSVWSLIWSCFPIKNKSTSSNKMLHSLKTQHSSLKNGDWETTFPCKGLFSGGRTVSFWECTFVQLLPFPFSLSGRFGSEVPKCFHALEETFAPQDLSFPRATPLSLLPPASALWVWKRKNVGSGATNPSWELG